MGRETRRCLRLRGLLLQVCVCLESSCCLPFSQCFRTPVSVQGILFNELNTKEPVNPRSLSVEIFQEPLVGIGTRYTITGCEGTCRESEYSEQSLAVRSSRTLSS